MNCGICLGRFREKKRCPGCNLQNLDTPEYCRKCSIKFCAKRKNASADFCYVCDRFPCRRLKQLDKRYRERYGMSMLENLEFIKTQGIRAFVRQEKTRWLCPACGSLLCVHRDHCLACGAKRRTWEKG